MARMKLLSLRARRRYLSVKARRTRREIWSGVGPRAKEGRPWPGRQVTGEDEESQAGKEYRCQRINHMWEQINGE